MAWQNKNTVRSLIILVALGLALSSCGRRGALETPVSATVVTTDDAGNPIEKSAEKPDRPFILDGLL